MGWREFKSSREIATSPARAFEFVADYRNVARVLEGVTRWRPLGRSTRSEGARFEVEMKTLGIPLGNILILDGWKPGELISWRSESGLIAQRGRWRFEAIGKGTLVSLEIAYQPPGAAVGNFLAARVDSTVRARLTRALREMAAVLEADAE